MKKQFNDIRNDFAIAMAKMNAINEKEFTDKEAFNKYVSSLKNGMHDSTEVIIAGKKVKAGEVNKPEEDDKKLLGLNKITDNIEKALADITDPEQKANAEELLSGIKKIQDPNISAEEKKELLGKYVESGWIKKNAGGTKLYVDTASTGLYRKSLGDKSSPKALIDVANDYGIDNIEKEGSKRIAKKAMTGAKIFGDKKAKMEVKQLDNGVSIDGADYTRHDVPSDERLLEIYGNEKEAKRAKKVLEKYNKIIDLTAKAFKDIDNIETLSAFPDTPPTTPENRKKLKDGTADILADGFAKQFADEEPTKEQQAIIDDFKNLKDIKDQQEYDDKLMEITGRMMKDPYMSTGAADVVEMVSYMRELNKGNSVYMPAASNFPLGDIVSISPEKVDFEKDSPEEIQRKLQLIMTSVETRSIKKDAGGASASGDKTELTEYKEYTSKDGKKISPEEVKGDLTKMSNKTEMYSSIFDGDTAKAHEDIKAMSKKYDFDLEDPKYKARKEKSITSAIAYVKKKNQDIDEDKLRAQYEAYYDLGNIYANTYNATADSQMFTNEVWKYDKKEGKAKVNKTDGLDTLSLLKFEFNIGFGATGRPSNPVPTRFQNQEGEE